jgi:hypothetical protein
MDFIFATVGVSRTLNAINDVTNQNDSTGATFQTKVNINTVDNLYGNLGFGTPIGKNWIIENNISASHLSYRSELFGGNVDNQSWLINLYMQHTISLPKDFKVQISGWWQNGFIYGIFQLRPMGGMDVGFSKSLLANKISLSLNFNAIFFTAYPRVNINFQNQNVELKNRNESRRVMFRLTYNFGNSKAARRSQSKSAADDLRNRAGGKKEQ